MSISKVETPPFCCQIGGSNIKSIADFHAWRIEAWCKKIALIIKKKCTVAGVCKNMETNKTRMTNCKYSWPFWLMMEVTDEVIGQWKWAMSSQKLIKHMLIIVTMNRKVKKEILRKWAKQGQATSVLEFLKRGNLTVIEKKWRWCYLLDKWLGYADRKCYNMCLNSHLK